MATTDTYKVVIDTTQAQQAIAKMNNAIGSTSAAFGRLKTTLMGIGFAAFAKSAIAAAGELKDLAESSGVAVESLYKLSAALQTSGGNADKLPQMITTFSKSLDEAAQGSLKAQNTFRELGISISDLSNSSSQDLLKKTVLGLASIEDPVRRTALQMNLLGKGAMTLSPEGLKQWAKEMENGSEATNRTANAIKRAGDLNDQFNLALFNLKLAFVEAFEPAIKLVNTWAEKTQDGTSQLDKMVVVLKTVGVVMAAVFASSAGYALVKIVGMLGRGFIALRNILMGAGVATTAVGTAAKTAVTQGIFRAAGPHMNALRAIVVAVAAIAAGVTAASALFDDLGDIIANAAARGVEEIGLLAAEILNFPTDAIAGILNLFGAGIKDPVGLGSGLKTMVENARKAREEYEAQAKAQKEAARAAKEATGSGENAPAGRTVDTTEYDKAIAKIKEMGSEYVRNNEKIKNQITLETVLIGKSSEQQEMIRAMADLYQREADEIEKLTQAKANLSKEEKDAGVGAEIDRQIALIKERTKEEEKTLEILIQRKQEEQQIADIKKFSLQQDIATQEKLRQITSDTAQLTMGTLAKSYKEIEDAAENTYQSKLAEARLNNQELSASDIAKIRDAAYAGVEAQKAAKKEYYDASRSFSTGWQQAFNDYVENATNAAEQARNVFQQVTKGMEDLIINFAKTGKFEFNNFINSIVEMLLRSEIQRTMAQIFQTNKVGSAGGGGLFSALGSMLGFANGGMIPTNQPVLVGERGPEILSGVGGRTVIPNNQLNGGGSTNVTYNINAVDARSFQQLVAADPSFIYAVTLKGQRSIPGGR